MIDNQKIGGLAEFFDLIALPKGQIPGGPIQASTGEWCLVLPLQTSIDWNVRRMIDGMKRGRLREVDEIDMAIMELQSYRRELAGYEVK